MIDTVSAGQFIVQILVHGIRKYITFYQVACNFQTWL